MKKKKIDHFVEKTEEYMANEITKNDVCDLMCWISVDEKNLNLFNRILCDYTTPEKIDETFNHIDKVSDNFIKRTFENCVVEAEKEKSFYFKYKQLIYIAASCLFVIVSGWFLYLSDLKNQPRTPSEIAALFINLPQHSTPANLRTSIRIGSKDALILDEVKDTLHFNNNYIHYKNGEIIQDISTNEKSSYIFVETPYNSKVTIQLNDGSIIDIHPGSSLRFPIEFTQNERIVSLAGEAFFHVQKKNDKQPFKIDVINHKLIGSPQVKVLGTSFWVSSQEENNYFETGVLSGVIEVHYADNKETILPGKTAIGSSNGIITKEFNLDLLSSKLKGKLSWDNQDIGNILLTLKKWYNLDLVVSEDFDISRKFTITLDPDQQISDNLKILYYLGINFKFDTSVFPNRLHIIN